MGIVEILSASFRAVWDNPKTIIPYFVLTIITSIIAIPFTGILSSQIASSTAFSTSLTMASLIAAISTQIPLIILYVIVILAVGILLTPLIIGTYMKIGLQAVQGQVDVGSAFNSAKKMYKPLLVTYFLQSLISLIISLIIIAPFIGSIVNLAGAFITLTIQSASQATPPTAATIPPALLSTIESTLPSVILFGIIALIVLIIINIIFFEVMAIVVVEQKSGLTAIKRSIDVGLQNFVSIFLLLLLFAVSFVVIIVIASIIAGIIGAIFGLVSSLLSRIVIDIIIYAATAFLTAWLFISQIYFYNSYVRQATVPPLSSAPAVTPGAATRSRRRSSK